MPTIIEKRFDQEVQNILRDLNSGYHAGELSIRESSELPENIYVIDVENEMAGYAVIWEYNSGNQLVHKAENYYFSPDEKYLEKDFYIDIKNKTDFIFIEALDVLKEFEGKGYGAFFMNWLKAKYPSKKMYVYTLEHTKNFWYKQGFEALGNTVWMTYN